MPYSWESRPAIIYALRCKATGRIYVGATTNLEQRIKQHFRDLDAIRRGGCANHHAAIFQKEYNLYGKNEFEVYILEKDVPGNMRREREAHYIEMYNTANPDYGYNVKTERPIDYGIVFHEGLPPKRGDSE